MADRPEATFFVLGREVKAHPELVATVAALDRALATLAAQGYNFRSLPR